MKHQHKRVRFTLAGMMFTVAACAALLFLRIEYVAVLRRQAIYRGSAARYAKLESSALGRRRMFIKSGVWQQDFARQLKESISKQINSYGNRPRSDMECRLIASKIRSYEEAIASGRDYMRSADEATANANSFRELKESYERASVSLWFGLFGGAPYNRSRR